MLLKARVFCLVSFLFCSVVLNYRTAMIGPPRQVIEERGWYPSLLLLLSSHFFFSLFACFSFPSMIDNFLRLVWLSLKDLPIAPFRVSWLGGLGGWVDLRHSGFGEAGRVVSGHNCICLGCIGCLDAWLLFIAMMKLGFIIHRGRTGVKGCWYSLIGVILSICAINSIHPEPLLYTTSWMIGRRYKRRTDLA